MSFTNVYRGKIQKPVCRGLFNNAGSNWDPRPEL